MIVEANNIITYIIETSHKELYCGKTNNIKRRIKEHMKEDKPHWFAFNNRKQMINLYIIKGNYEQKIKSFGLKKFMEVVDSINNIPISPLLS